jgi:ADP-ribosylglycohydrolase
MLGAIAGDIVGSVYERRPIKRTDFPLFQEGSRFTDDSVLTAGVADAILQERGYADAIRDWGRRYPTAGYGGSFLAWLARDDAGPYGSWGNGSAMRVSPVGWAFDNVDRVLAEAEASAAVTHDHPEGIKGAHATALAVYLARTGASKARIRDELSDRFAYDLTRSPEEIRPGYRFDVSCQGSVPESLVAFLHADDFESAVRIAVSLGGDTDTMAAIAGAVAEAFHGGVPAPIARETRARLTAEILEVCDAFNARHDVPG